MQRACVSRRSPGRPSCRCSAPPWNRLPRSLVPRLPEVGLHGLSGFGRRGDARARCQGNQYTRGHHRLARYARLRAARKPRLPQSLSNWRSRVKSPIGVLTHHAMHDEGAWAFRDGFSSARAAPARAGRTRNAISYCGLKAPLILPRSRGSGGRAADDPRSAGSISMSTRAPSRRSTACRFASRRRHGGAGRRVGLGQVGDRAGDHGHPAAIARIVSGEILFRDPARAKAPVDITALDARGRRIRRIRGGRISIIFQEPMTSLSPLHTIGDQIGEALACIDRTSARGRARDARDRDAAPGRLPRSGEGGATPIRSSFRAACASAP